MESNISLKINFFNHEFDRNNLIGKVVNIKFKSIENSFVKVLLTDYNNFEGIIMNSDLKKKEKNYSQKRS